MARGGWLSSAAQSPQEAFQKFSLERSVVREGSFVRQDRIDLLLILIKPENIRAYAAMQKFVDKVAALRDTHPCGSTTNVLWEQECKAAMNRSKIAGWRAISLEFIVTIVLETELEECVVLMESLKFWRQLAQMQGLQRRLFYPTLHLREGGIRRTSLRRAARLDAMLHDKATKVGQLQRLLYTVRGLTDFVIKGISDNGCIIKVQKSGHASTDLSECPTQPQLPHSKPPQSQRQLSSASKPNDDRGVMDLSSSQHSSIQADMEGTAPSDSIRNTCTKPHARTYGSNSSSSSMEESDYLRSGSGTFMVRSELSSNYLRYHAFVEKEVWKIIRTILDHSTRNDTATTNWMPRWQDGNPSPGQAARLRPSWDSEVAANGPALEECAEETYSDLPTMRGSVFFGRQMTGLHTLEDDEFTADPSARVKSPLSFNASSASQNPDISSVTSKVEMYKDGFAFSSVRDDLCGSLSGPDAGGGGGGGGRGAVHRTLDEQMANHGVEEEAEKELTSKGVLKYNHSGSFTLPLSPEYSKLSTPGEYSDFLDAHGDHCSSSSINREKGTTNHMDVQLLHSPPPMIGVPSPRVHHPPFTYGKDGGAAPSLKDMNNNDDISKFWETRQRSEAREQAFSPLNSWERKYRHNDRDSVKLGNVTNSHFFTTDPNRCVEGRTVPCSSTRHSTPSELVNGLSMQGCDIPRLAKQVIAHMKAAPAATTETMGTAAPPSRMMRLWPWWTFYGFIAASLGMWSIKHRKKVDSLLNYARKNAKDFYQEHVQGPVTQIIDELIFNKRSRITDRQALDETKASLTNMLQAFNNDYGKNLSEEERQRLAKKQDMSLVEKKFGEHVEHALYNAVTGEIARVLLIQVQFIKKELLVAMSSIEDLMDANNFNFRLMATVPAVMVAVSVYLGMKKMARIGFNYQTREERFSSLRTMLLDIERALARYCAVVEQRHLIETSRPPEASTKDILGEDSQALSEELCASQKASFSLGKDVRAHSSKGPRIQPTKYQCNETESGLLLVLAWRFRRLLASTSESGRRLERSEVLALHADLDELCNGGLDPPRQLDLVKRVAVSYRFLALSPPSHGESAYAHTFLR